jgi:hypothetical protein
MGTENQLVTPAATAAPTAGPTYPTLLLRLWLVRARLDFRARVRKVWTRDTSDDRRLAAVLVAVGVAVVMLLGSLAAGLSATTCIVHVGIGFFAALGVSLALLFGPDDYDCNDELVAVTGLMPEAKRVWDENRAAARAARAVRKAERAERRAATQAARKVEQDARKRAAAEAKPDEALVELVPVCESSPEPETLTGDGAYAVPVMSEVHVGRILAAAFRDGLPPIGQDKDVSAVVRIADTSRDTRAVSVEIAGRKVGHLSKADGRALRQRVDHNGEQFKCRAAIRAGWKDGRVRYAVRLDVNLGTDRPSEIVHI